MPIASRPAARRDREVAMKRCMAFAASLLAAAAPLAQTVRFDSDTLGRAPAGSTCGITGRGSPHWSVESDASAPSPHHVLMQSGSGTFPWCVRADTAITDGFVEVKLKPLEGREDQAGGVICRWKSGSNYYVARANALENNVSLYYTEGGNRRTLKYVNTPVSVGAWHTLRVDFAGARIAVMWNGKVLIKFEDAHISGPGGIGVWTKADSVTAFGDFSFGQTKR
ncbi:hypothetical protein [Variovorax soli]|uniref:3-keto-disaccharide hydrolase domain-containing protein n=1 Tax=Variovorax soli TaxID=376815 RepID=A0ABU1NP01_9BURK|nr:hypothetical protein [Variovorax soli]MDR6539730.1 hypothetical protein [Variovorax soli]